MRTEPAIALPPLSGPALRAIGRGRARLQRAALSIEEASETVWRISGPGGDLLYFPYEDRWRRDTKWGRGTVTLIAELQEDMT